MTQPDRPKAYVRVAKPDELDTVCQIMHRAFSDDPLFTYFGQVKNAESNQNDAKVKRALERWTRFLPTVASLLGARITVAVMPPATGEGKEVIGAAAVWMPPKRRLAMWRVPSFVKAGVIPVLREWGLTGLMRTIEYLDGAEHSINARYKANGIKESPHHSWYLNLVGTDTEFQGQGLLSLLVREAYDHAPNASFTLEATTPKSRDRYAHLGFELLEEIRIGKGKVDDLGYPTSRKDAVGVPIAVMAKLSK